jgi:Domain of unknown function (DUF4157)
MSFGLAQQRKVSKVADSKISASTDHHASILHSNNDNSYSTAAVGLAPDSFSYVQRAIANSDIDNKNKNKNNHHQSANNNNGSKELMRSNYNAPDNSRLDFARGINNIQPKLKVSEPGDIYEQEADRVAEKVMNMPSIPFFYPAARPVENTSEGEGLDKKCTACEMKGHEKIEISRKPSHASTLDASHQVSNEINTFLSGPGSSLDANTKEFMESRFGYDLSNVRIHTEAVAAKSAESVNAFAYTVGNDIAFGEGQYHPDTIEGRRLLAHELTHVAQQSQLLRYRTASSSSRNGNDGEGHLSQNHANGLAKAYIQKPNSTPTQIARAPKPGSGGDLMVDANILITLAETGGARAYEYGIKPGTRVYTIQSVADEIDKKRHDWNLLKKKYNITVLPDPKKSSSLAFKQLSQIGPLSETDALVGAKSIETRMPLSTSEERLAREVRRLGGVAKEMQVTSPPAGTVRSSEPLREPPVREPKRPKPVKARGTITVPQQGSVTPAGGSPRPVTSASGDITVPQQGSVTPAGGSPRPVTSASGEITVPYRGGPTVVESPVKLVVTQIALNVLLFAVTYYINKWHAEKQVRKFNDDLKGLLPGVNTRLKNKEAEIVEKGNVFPLVYGNITIFFTRDISAEEYNKGSMSIRDVAISHQNYNTPQRPVNGREIDPYNAEKEYLLTFSVPLFEEKTAEKGASSLVRTYRQQREALTHPGEKARLSAVIQLYSLAKQDSSLETLVVRDLLGALKDEDAKVRLAAANYLSLLKAKIAIQFILEVIPITSNDEHKKMIQGYLSELTESSGGARPDIATIHSLLASIRTDLLSVRVGMAGEAVALDYLNVALQATDMAGHNAFKNKTPAERYQLTTDAIAHSLSVLNGLDDKNPALKRVIDRLRGTKFLVDNALANR